MTTMTKFDAIETDKRILDQRLRRHEISQQEFTKLLRSAPDEKENYVELAPSLSKDDTHSA